MTVTKTMGLLATAAASTMLLTGSVQALDPRHCPPGHERQGRCEFGERYDRDRHNDRDEERAYRDGYRDGVRAAWRAGDRLEGVDYHVIRSDEYGRYGLTPPPNGYYYAKVDEDVLLVSAATQIIRELLD